MTSLKACFIMSLSFLKKKSLHVALLCFIIMKGKTHEKLLISLLSIFFVIYIHLTNMFFYFSWWFSFGGWEIWRKLQNLRNVIVAKNNPSWEDANFVRMCITILVFNSSLIDLSFRVISSSSSDSSWLQVTLASISLELSDAQDS